MTTSTFALSRPHPVQLYFHNLGRAARYFGAALVAAVPRPPEFQTSLAPANVESPEHDALSRAAAADLLHSLAIQFDSTQPNQAAELRWLASRG